MDNSGGARSREGQRWSRYPMQALRIVGGVDRP